MKKAKKSEVMRAFVGLLAVLCCAGLIGASESKQKASPVEGSKQEKRSLSHGVLGGGYPSQSYQNYAGPYGSYGVAGAGYLGSDYSAATVDASCPGCAVSSSGGVSVSGPGIITSAGGSSVGLGGVIGTGPAVFGPGPGVAVGGFGAGPGVAVGGFGAGPAVGVGVSTNTDTLTTIRQNVPVAVPVDRPIPM